MYCDRDFAVYKHATYNNKNHGQKVIYMYIGMWRNSYE